MATYSSPLTRSRRHSWAPALVLITLVALLVPTIGIPIARGELSGLFAPSLGLAVPFALVGAFLLARGGTRRIAVLVSVIGLLSAASTLSAVLQFVADASGSAAGDTVARWITNLSAVPTLTLLAPLGLLLPDGHLSGPRWRWLIALDVLLAVGFLALAGLEPGADLLSSDPSVLFDGAPHPALERLSAVMFLVLVGTVLISVGALVARRRRAVGVERAQLTCLLYGGTLNAVLLAATIPVPDGGWGFAVLVLTATPLPVSIGVAVLRYRLYEIDRIVSRTVTYGVVLVLLAGIYIGVVVGLTALLPADIGQVGVAAATLVVSVLAVPLTRRVRGVVDRRFNRSRFDAELVVAAFAARLRARPERGDVPGDLLAVVGRTVSPAHADIWLAPR